MLPGGSTSGPSTALHAWCSPCFRHRPRSVVTLRRIVWVSTVIELNPGERSPVESRKRITNLVQRKYFEEIHGPLLPSINVRSPIRNVLHDLILPRPESRAFGSHRQESTTPVIVDASLELRSVLLAVHFGAPRSCVGFITKSWRFW